MFFSQILTGPLSNRTPTKLKVLTCEERNYGLVPNSPFTIIPQDNFNEIQIRFDVTHNAESVSSLTNNYTENCHMKLSFNLDYADVKPKPLKGCVTLEQQPHKSQNLCLCLPDYHKHPTENVCVPGALPGKRGLRNCREVDSDGNCKLCSIGHLDAGRCRNDEEDKNIKLPADEEEDSNSCFSKEVTGGAKKCLLCNPGYFPLSQDENVRCTNIRTTADHNTEPNFIEHCLIHDNRDRVETFADMLSYANDKFWEDNSEKDISKVEKHVARVIKRDDPPKGCWHCKKNYVYVEQKHACMLMADFDYIPTKTWSNSGKQYTITQDMRKYSIKNCRIVRSVGQVKLGKCLKCFDNVDRAQHLDFRVWNYHGLCQDNDRLAQMAMIADDMYIPGDEYKPSEEEDENITDIMERFHVILNDVELIADIPAPVNFVTPTPQNKTSQIDLNLEIEMQNSNNWISTRCM